ncbi:MAG: serine hydrolase domain-containing protein [Bacillota bacterium]
MDLAVDEIRSFVENMMERHRVPGMAVAIAREGEPVLAEGFGRRDRERDLPVSPRTIFGVGSITKSATALATMQLVDRGIVSVDDPVREWLPEFRLPRGGDADSITVHHFLTHTSGLPSLPSRFYAQLRDIRRDPNAERMQLPIDPEELYPIDTFEDLMDLLAEMDFEMLGPPGGQFSYSNEGFGLLSAIIERASGEKYARFVERNIFEPLDMKRSGFDPDEIAEKGEVTQLYASVGEGEDKDVFAAPGWWKKKAMYGCGHMKSCVEDLVKYFEVYRLGGKVRGERIASEESIERMTSPQAEIVPGLHYGYGLQVQPDYLGFSLVRHGGSDKGTAAQVALVRDLDVTVAVQANLTNIPVEGVALGLINTAGGLDIEAEPAKPTVQMEPEELRRYEGSFRSGEGAAVSFYVEDGELVARLGGKEREVVFHDAQSATIIVGDDVHTPVRFLFDQDGELWAIHMRMRMIRREN